LKERNVRFVSQVLGFIWGGGLASFASTRLTEEIFMQGSLSHSTSALSSNQHFRAVGMVTVDGANKKDPPVNTRLMHKPKGTIKLQ
jgi:hypothetical protein